MVNGPPSSAQGARHQRPEASVILDEPELHLIEDVLVPDIAGWRWFVQAIAQMLEVYRLDGETYRLVASHGADEVVRAEPFGAIELELAALWAR